MQTEIVKIQANAPIGTMQMPSLHPNLMLLLDKQELDKYRGKSDTDRCILYARTNALHAFSPNKLQKNEKRLILAMSFKRISELHFADYDVALTILVTEALKRENPTIGEKVDGIEDTVRYIIEESSYFSDLTLAELSNAMKKGSMGHYGKYFGVNAKTISDWVSSYKNEKRKILKGLERFRSTVNLSGNAKLHYKISDMFRAFETDKKRQTIAYFTDMRLFYILQYSTTPRILNIEKLAGKYIKFKDNYKIAYLTEFVNDYLSLPVSDKLEFGKKIKQQHLAYNKLSIEFVVTDWITFEIRLYEEVLKLDTKANPPEFDDLFDLLISDGENAEKTVKINALKTFFAEFFQKNAQEQEKTLEPFIKKRVDTLKKRKKTQRINIGKPTETKDKPLSLNDYKNKYRDILSEDKRTVKAFINITNKEQKNAKKTHKKAFDERVKWLQSFL